MDPLVGIEAEIVSFFDDQDQQRLSSDGCKQVPWLSWDEWDSVRESVFSSSSDRVASALDRIATWRSRGSLPAPVDVTASIIEIQQKDGFTRREEQPTDAIYTEHLLQMLYCMGILRLVNCVIEKTRKRTEVSIAEAAKAIGLPRKLIDLRHEGSHRELPALSVLRDASDEALDWLKSYYWEPQKSQIPFKKEGTASIRREIKSKLRKLALCLRLRQNPQLGSTLVKEKCSKKRIRKILTALIELYYYFSSDVVSVLLEFLLKALESSKLAELPNEPEAGQDLIRGFLDEWKSVIIKFSNKEPELLLSLLQALLDMIKNNEGRRYETELCLISKSNEEVSSQVEQLPFLFAWLVGHLKGLKRFQKNSSSGVKEPNTFLVELLRKCLLLSAFGYDELVNSALQLAELTGGHVWKEKLTKLAITHNPILDVPREQSSSLITASEMRAEQEKSIRDAAKKLEFVKLQLSKKKSEGTKETDPRVPKRWVKAKTWNPCPLGMLPRVLGSSGRLPVLDCSEVTTNTQSISKPKQAWGIQPCNSTKREAECNIEQLDDSTAKRVRKTVKDPESIGRRFDSSDEDVNMDTQEADDGLRLKDSDSEENLIFKDKDSPSLEDGRGCLMIGGECRRVGDEELLAIASAVRILV